MLVAELGYATYVLTDKGDEAAVPPAVRADESLDAANSHAPLVPMSELHVRDTPTQAPSPAQAQIQAQPPITPAATLPTQAAALPRTVPADDVISVPARSAAGPVIPEAPSPNRPSRAAASSKPAPSQPRTRSQLAAVQKSTPKPTGSTHASVAEAAQDTGSRRRPRYNPVAAASTEKLVRESARPDPSLPQPWTRGEPPPRRATNGSSRSKSDRAVAAAMTAQLVRDSAQANRSPAATGKGGDK